MKSRLLYKLLTGFLIFNSCDTNVDFEGQYYPPEQVVYGDLNGDSTISVRVTYSASVQAGVLENMRNVEDAKVILIENQKDSIRITHNENGNYLGSYIPNPESEYQLYVESKYGKMLSNKIQIDDKLYANNMTFKPYSRKYFNYTNQLNFTTSLGEEIEQVVRIRAAYYDYEKKIFKYIKIIEISDEIISYCGGFNASESFVYYTNEECNPEGNLEAHLALSVNEIPETFRNRLYIKIANASSEYLEFENLFYKYSAFDLFFEEPLQPYSSFDNGYGYFASFNETQYIIDLN